MIGDDTNDALNAAPCAPAFPSRINHISGRGRLPDSSGGQSCRLRIGAEVLAGDGICGELTRIIIDPIKQTLTHLVVTPRHDGALGRLVSAELGTPDGQQIRLACSAAHFYALDDAQDIHVLPASGEVWGYGRDQAYSWPYYGLRLGGGTGTTALTRGALGLDGGAAAIVFDRVPLGEVQVRRGDDVHATDGWIGSAQGLVVDPRDHHATHVLLQEGHVWGRKQVAIPIGATSHADEAIWVDLTKQQVYDLPPVDLSSSP